MAPWLSSSFDRTLPPEFRLMNPIAEPTQRQPSIEYLPTPRRTGRQDAAPARCFVKSSSSRTTKTFASRLRKHSAPMGISCARRSTLELKNADPLLASIPVVMMSATERRRHSGAADLVAQPMDLDDLERVIKQHYESP